MALDKKFVGKAYGPYTYELGSQKMKEFAYAVGGSVPSAAFPSIEAPEGLHPWLHDAAKSPSGRLVAMPNFAVTFAIAPFGAAIADPELGINMMMLVHGEQEFEWFEPMLAGDVMTTTGVITSAFSKSGKDFLSVETESRNQRGALVVKALWTAVIRG